MVLTLPVTSVPEPSRISPAFAVTGPSIPACSAYRKLSIVAVPLARTVTAPVPVSSR